MFAATRLGETKHMNIRVGDYFYHVSADDKEGQTHTELVTIEGPLLKWRLRRAVKTLAKRMKAVESARSLIAKMNGEGNE